MTSVINSFGPTRFLLSTLRKQRGLTERAAWSFAAAFLARGANLIAMTICARVLGKEEFGVVAVIQGTIGMFAPFAGMGLALTTTKFVSEYRDCDPERAGRILALSLWAAAVAGVVMTAALVVLSPQLAVWGFAAPDLQRHLVAASGLLMLGVIEAVQAGALAGFEAFSRIARLSLWVGSASLPVTAALVYRYGTSGAIAALTISLAVSCVLHALALRVECRQRGVRISALGWMSERHMLFSFSLPAYLSGMLVAPVTWLSGALLVRHSGGFAEMAAFTAADRFRYLLIFAPLAVSRIAMPVLSRLRAGGDHSGYRSALRWNLGFALAATVPPALVCALFSRRLMALFGDSFGESWPVLAVLALSAIPTVLNTQLGAAVLSNGRAWSRMLADAILAVVFMTSAWILVERWNALGLAASLAVAYSCACIFLWIALRDIDRGRREQARAA